MYNRLLHHLFRKLVPPERIGCVITLRFGSAANSISAPHEGLVWRDCRFGQHLYNLELIIGATLGPIRLYQWLRHCFQSAFL